MQCHYVLHEHDGSKFSFSLEMDRKLRLDYLCGSLKTHFFSLLSIIDSLFKHNQYSQQQCYVTNTIAQCLMLTTSAKPNKPSVLSHGSFLKIKCQRNFTTNTKKKQKRPNHIHARTLVTHALTPS